ncbi:sigma-70 family RNA polymerase sigma factor [Planctomycetota bacterium]
MMTDRAQGDFLAYFIPAQAALRRFILAHVADLHHAEDLFQEVARTLWGQFDRFDRTKAFEPWAVGVARNMVLRYRRDRTGDVLVFSEHVSRAICRRTDDQPSPLERKRAFLRECIQKLPPQSQSVVRMKYTEGRRIDDIASSIGRSSNAVRLLLFRIRGAIAKCISSTVAGAERGGAVTV